MNRRFVITCGAVFVAAIIGSRFGATPDPTSERGAVEARLDEMERAQQRGEVRSALARRGSTTVVVAPTEQAPSGEPPSTSPEELEGQDRAADREQFTELAQAFSAEPIDARWAEQQRTDLQASFEAAKLGALGRIAKVECRSQRCALEIEHVRDAVAADPRSTKKLVDWLLGQSCGFHVEGHAAADSRTRRIFLDCASRT